MRAIRRGARAWLVPLALVLTTATAGWAGPPQDGAGPPVGWCAFYPAVDVGMDALPGSGASILSVCAGGWGMAPAPGVYDFAALDRQIAYAEQHGLTLALINEINPLYTPGWLRRQVRDAGESVRDAGGGVGAVPSVTSAVFARAQEELVRETVEHVRRRDRSGVVRVYHPGAEWWFPPGERYHPADVARFRAWLRRKYGTVDAVNAAWGGRFAAFDAVPAPKVDLLGRGPGSTGLAPAYSLDDGSAHASWSTARATDPAAAAGPATFAAVTPGTTYTASAWVRCDDLRGPGAFVEVAWVGRNGGPPVRIDDGPSVRGTAPWRRIAVTATAPKDAGRAWVLLKLIGGGTATFDDVALRGAAGGPNLVPDPGLESTGAASAWSFQNWAGGTGVDAAHPTSGGRDGPACVRITTPRVDPAARGYADVAAAAHDWSAFWYEAAAGYINGLARQVKRLDPSRQTVTYLTMSWAYPSEWDESQRSAIAPDEVARQGRDIDAFGMQLCAADGDAYRVTACLDLMRKYGKPLWAVDLVDFTSGVAVGYPAMDRATQAAVQHGASGLIYCAWHMPTVLDYSFYPNMAAPDVRRMLTDAKAAVRLMDGLRVRPTGALVLPILPASPADAEGFKNDVRSAVGWYKILERLHRTFDVVTLRELETGSAPLDRYGWVVVPDCAFLPAAARDRLSAFARAGGRVVTGGRFALHDEAGRPLPAGPASVPVPVPRLALADLGRRHAGDPVRDTHAGNTPPLFLWKTDGPDAAPALEAARAGLRDVFETSRVRPDHEVDAAGCDVTAVAYEGGATRAVYLVNRGPREAIGVHLRVRAGADTRPEVFVDLAPCEPRARPSGGWSEITLPAFRSSAIVRLGPGAR